MYPNWLRKSRYQQSQPCAVAPDAAGVAGRRFRGCRRFCTALVGSLSYELIASGRPATLCAMRRKTRIIVVAVSSLILGFSLTSELPRHFHAGRSGISQALHGDLRMKALNNDTLLSMAGSISSRRRSGPDPPAPAFSHCVEQEARRDVR